MFQLYKNKVVYFTFIENKQIKRYIVQIDKIKAFMYFIIKLYYVKVKK